VLGDKVPGKIDRTTTRSYLRIAPGYVPDNLKGLVGFGGRLFPSLLGGGGIQIGPIPPNTPVNLLANLNLLADDSDLLGHVDHDRKVLELLIRVKKDLLALGDNPSDDEARRVLTNLVSPLMDLSKCPDYVVNRGHYFGTKFFKEEPELSDRDKHALIEFLKTF
jgi:hypothetical protein